MSSGGVLLSRPQSRRIQPQNQMLISSYQLHRLQTAQLTLPYAQLFNRNVVTRNGIGHGAQKCDPPVHFRLPSNWFYSNSTIWTGNTRILLLLLLSMDVSCHRPFLPGTSLEPAVIPTAHASSITLQYFPYYV